jgi:putative endonuclease
MKIPKPDWTQLRQRRERGGRDAEAAAALWLQLKGYRILERRARTPACEIDLVALRGNILAFIEVKARATHDSAIESVTPQLRARIRQAAHQWCARRRGMENRNWRFDIIAIAPGRLPLHMRDAWRGEG